MISTPMVLRKDSNLGPSRGLVKMSAFVNVDEFQIYSLFLHQISNEVVSDLDML